MTTPWLRPVYVICGCALTCAPAVAGSWSYRSSDTYMISRDAYESFKGSHKIFRRQSDGLVKVDYCGTSYWIRPVTVAWTQVEVENRRTVRVEFNWGKGWRPICEHPEQKVTLQDLGIEDDPRTVLVTGGKSADSAKRFSEILKSFQGNGNTKKKTTFHEK